MNRPFIGDEERMGPIEEIHIGRQKKTLVQKWANRTTLYMAVVLASLVVIGSVDSVLYVRMAHKMQNYEWFLSQIVVTTGFLLISWPVVLYKKYISKTITPASTKVSYKVFIFVALFDGLSTLLGTIPAPYIDGPVMRIIAQMNIPFLMLFSFIHLKARYKWNHFMGVFVIILGVLVNSISLITSTSPNVSTNIVVWIAIFCCSIVPATMSSIWKENSLKNDAGGTMDEWYFNAKVALFQFVWGILAFWVVYVPLPKPAPHIVIQETPQHLANAALCFMGVNSAESRSECSFVWVIFSVYILFNVAVNVLALHIFKIASALVAVIVGTASLIVVTILFHIELVAGEALVTQFSIFNLIALFVVLFGIFLFRWKNEKRAGKPASPLMGLDYGEVSVRFRRDTYAELGGDRLDVVREIDNAAETTIENIEAGMAVELQTLHESADTKERTVEKKSRYAIGDTSSSSEDEGAEEKDSDSKKFPKKGVDSGDIEKPTTIVKSGPRLDINAWAKATTKANKKEIKKQIKAKKY